MFPSSLRKKEIFHERNSLLKYEKKMADLGFTNIFINAFKYKLYVKISINFMTS